MSDSSSIPRKELLPTAEIAGENLDTAEYAPEVPSTGTTANVPGAPDAGRFDFLQPPQAPGELGRLGPYRVLELLGAGGMGLVFRAEDTELARHVALKVVRPEIMADPQARQRFRREAQAAAALRHDHIVVIYQVGEQAGVSYMAMEFLSGETLVDRLRRLGPLPLDELLEFGSQIADGLAAAHAAGIVHRDIKPGNLWVEERPGRAPRIKILDFGLARAVEADNALTQSGVVLGTFQYMSPEQASGEAIDQRADLFSLGAVLYCMATARRPFAGDNARSSLRSVLIDDPKSPLELRPELPAALSELILRLLSKDPLQRPQSADDVRDALQAIGKNLAAAVSVPASLEESANRIAGQSVAGHSQDGKRKLRVACTLVALALLAAASYHHFSDVPSGNDKAPSRDSRPSAAKEATGGDRSAKDTALAASGSVTDKTNAAAPRGSDPVITPPVDAAEPFFVDCDGEPSRKFRTLAEAIAAATGATTIDIHGNGPFFCDTIHLPRVPITICAARGYRPRLVQGRHDAPVDGDFLAGSGRLVLEGLELVRHTVPESTSAAIVSNWGSFAAANCRFVLNGPGQVIHAGDPDLSIRSCEFLMSAASWGGIQWYPAQGATASRLHVENSLFYSADVARGQDVTGVSIISSRDLQPMTVEITGCTLGTKSAINLRFLNPDEEQSRRAGKFCTLRLVDNVFAVRQSLIMYMSNPANKILPADRAVALTPQIIAFQESGNLVTKSAPIMDVTIVGVGVPSRPEYENLSAWQRWLGISESTSRQASIRFRGDIPNARELDELQPQQFELATPASGKPSPGIVSGSVGPGRAYDDWRSTDDYKAWRAGK